MFKPGKPGLNGGMGGMDFKEVSPIS